THIRSLAEPAIVGFWAKIKSIDYSTGKYGYQQVELADDGTWSDTDDDEVEDDDDAAAVERQGFKFCPVDTRVWLMPSETSELYVFDSPILSAIGKSNASISKGASGSVSVYKGSAGSETDTGQDVTAWNKAVAIANNKVCVLTWGTGHPDNIYVSLYDC